MLQNEGVGSPTFIIDIVKCFGEVDVGNFRKIQILSDV